MKLRVQAKDIENIQILMAKKGLIKNTLAQTANIHNRTLTRFFKYEYVTPTIVKKICNVLNIDENRFDEFFIIKDISKSEQ